MTIPPQDVIRARETAATCATVSEFRAKMEFRDMATAIHWNDQLALNLPLTTKTAGPPTPGVAVPKLGPKTKAGAKP